MQKNIPLARHKASRLFSKFCADMSVLPSYTPVFLMDISGQITERKNLKITDGFSDIASVTDKRDLATLVSSHSRYDAFAVRTSEGDGKSFIVVSKDKSGFSRCVVCSVSENGCVKLRDYYEKLACYKDYLDSFASLLFSSDARMPVLRIFRMRMSGVTELMRLSEEGGTGRNLSFPLRTAMEKISALAGVMDGGTRGVLTCEIDEDVTVNTPEGFFKLMLSVCALFVRCSTAGTVNVGAVSQGEGKGVKLCISCRGKADSKIYVEALKRAFERTAIKCLFEFSEGRMSFECELKAAAKRAEIVSDSAEFELMVDRMLGDEGVLDLYRTVADIT